MSCCSSCGDTAGDCSCNPCAAASTTVEGLSSQISNLINALLGSFTKTIVNGRATWSAVCDPNSTGLSCNPKGETEGFICYLMRILANLAVFFEGTYDAGKAYCKNSFVVYNGASYVALVTAAAGLTPDVNPGTWMPVAVGTVGPAGPQGDPGAAGSGSAINYAIRTTAVGVTLGALDAVCFCEPVGAIAIQLPATTILSGKWFKIWTTGVANVTINVDGADVIDSGVALGASSYVLTTPGESIELVSNNAGKWRVL